jgi:hypothetical protein
MESSSTALAAVMRDQKTSSASELGDFDTLMRTEQKRIYRLLYAMLHDHDAADTLTQECFLRAYEHRQQFRGESSVHTWLVRIAVNLARDCARSRRLQFWRRLFHSPADSSELQVMIDPLPSPERTVAAREALAGRPASGSWEFTRSPKIGRTSPPEGFSHAGQCRTSPASLYSSRLNRAQKKLRSANCFRFLDLFVSGRNSIAVLR